MVSDEAEIIPDKINDRYMFSQFFLIVQDNSFCIGHGCIDRSFHRIRKYSSFSNLDKNFRRKNKEFIFIPKFISRAANVKNLLKRVPQLNATFNGEVGEVAIPVFQMTQHGFKFSLVLKPGNGISER